MFDDPVNTPEDVGVFNGSARNLWINLATTLDDHNNGLIELGHCLELIEFARERWWLRSVAHDIASCASFTK